MQNKNIHKHQMVYKFHLQKRKKKQNYSTTIRWKTGSIDQKFNKTAKEKHSSITWNTRSTDWNVKKCKIIAQLSDETQGPLTRKERHSTNSPLHFMAMVGRTHNHLYQRTLWLYKTYICACDLCYIINAKMTCTLCYIERKNITNSISWLYIFPVVVTNRISTPAKW